jgi:type IV pilus assembly protein PilY1
VNDTSRIAKFTTATWGAAPLTNANYCAPLNVLQFNASSSTFDDDELSTASDIGLSGGATGVKAWTDKVGDSTHQALSGSYFVGDKANGSATNDHDGICTGKLFGGLSLFTGSCPDAPRLGGSYALAGLAYYARSNDLNSNLTGTQSVRTLGVSLAPAVPSIKIPVPGTSGANQKYIQVLPACKNNRPSTVGPNMPTREGNCAIVDFKIVTTNIASGNTTNTAKLYVNWEVAEAGNDYDQDMWGTIDISVTNTAASVQTRILKMSAGPSIGFGYVISGTTVDGFKASSGANNFIEPGTYCSANGLCNCPNAACTQVAPAQVYPIAANASGATFLPSALELAARWGGYSADFAKQTKAAAAAANITGQTAIDNYVAAAIKARDISDSYYFATDPRALAESLAKAFKEIAAGIGAATSVATVSAKVSDGDYVYQAQFNSENWSGDLHAYSFVTNGSLSPNPDLCSSTIVVSGNTVCTGIMPTSSSGRTIYTNKSGVLAPLSWSNLTTGVGGQQSKLQLATEATTAEAIKRVDWLAGNATYETTSVGGILRDRGVVPNRKLLGDVVNSSPVYVGSKDFRYNSLSGAVGSSYSAFVTAKRSMRKMLMVGSNDGMLHAFDADTLAELFAFIPNASFTNLANLTMPDYGTSARPHTYFVDGPLTYGDAYINGGWHRIVVGAMGAGGKTIFALDVTNASPTLLFELDGASLSGMGYVLGKPSILPMRNGRFAVVFGNGDTSGATSTSKLLVVDLESPLNSSYTKILDTGEGTGLSAPAIEVNGIGEAVNAYAGDLDGNLWRFDLQDTNPNNWRKSYKLFKALSPTGVAQPITSSPTLGINASKNWNTMVYFGTGKYYEIGDVGNIVIQSFYAIADIGSTVSSASLLQKTMTNSVTSTTRTRTISQTNPNWTSQNGWYLNFDDQVNTNGERVTVKPLLLFDKLIFQTLIPSVNACDYGGSSWLMELTAVGDKYIGKSLLSPNLYNPYLILGELSFVYNKTTGGASVISNPSSSAAGIQQSALTLPTQVEGRESWHQAQ